MQASGLDTVRYFNKYFHLQNSSYEMLYKIYAMNDIPSYQLVKFLFSNKLSKNGTSRLYNKIYTVLLFIYKKKSLDFFYI